MILIIIWLLCGMLNIDIGLRLKKYKSYDSYNFSDNYKLFLVSILGGPFIFYWLMNEINK